MISTVTTTTVTTVTTATVAVAAGLSFLAVLTLLIVMIPKEVVAVSDQPRLDNLSRILNVVVLPLLIGFFLIALFKIAEAIP
ncbi:MAG: hypothetical protein JW900_15865 [Anaerolineae bacterium]|nr:hypothetical protein [Anaerolineae bacterium]